MSARVHWSYVGSMADAERPESLVAEAVDTAASFLRAGDEPHPVVITDNWGDRRTEQFEETGLLGAKEKFGALLGGTTTEQTCALVYISDVSREEGAIVVELGLPGEAEPKIYVQRFRPRKGPLRAFKLRGELREISPA
jgi:hypothetical protein